MIKGNICREVMNKLSFLHKNFFIILILSFSLSNFSPALTFNIGYIESESDRGLSHNWFQELESNVNLDININKELRKENFDSIVFLPTEGYVNCIQRMNIGEFDGVFCNAVVFCEQKGNYKPILQVRTERDRWRSMGGQPVLQYGIVFVRSDSQLAKIDNPTNEDIKIFISKRAMGFISQYSAVGYIVPMLKIRRDYDTNPAELIFCKSSEDVVKYVISGLIEIGACENGVIEEVFKKNNLDKNPIDKYVKVIFTTEPVPTDPFVAKEKYLPENSGLGKALKDFLRNYYSDKTQGAMHLEPSRDEYYDDLRELLKDFSQGK